jgi:uncharacterized membrane protein YgdD (TMEM256/DUF423 family)
MRSRWSTVGALLAFIGVALGAFGAHGLRERLGVEGREIWETATLYHLVHSLALILAGELARPEGRARIVCLAFSLGVLCFSGSLYALALGAPRWLGPITPLGGAAFLVGWLVLAFSVSSRAPA